MTGSVLLFPGFWGHFTARTTLVSVSRPNFRQKSILFGSTSSDSFFLISFGRLIYSHSMTGSVLLFPGFRCHFTARTTFVSAARPNFRKKSILFGSTSSDAFFPISFGRLIYSHSMIGSVLLFPGFRCEISLHPTPNRPISPPNRPISRQGPSMLPRP